jgi:c-di-GMP-binding flagellar brake protein YcgR
MNYAIELKPSQSKRVLECACRAQPEVRLLPKPWATPHPLVCRIIDNDDDGVILQASLTADADFRSLLNIYCQIELDLDDGQYFFDSNIVAVRQQDEHLHLSIGWPETILVQQRRRSHRLPLARSSTVQLSHLSGEHLETISGRLYNLSEDGMAFQVLKADADAIEPGQTWCACFEVPEQDHCYKFEGVIRRTLPSSSADAVILGMQFEHANIDLDELTQLREFLSDRQHSGAASGGSS